MKGNLYAMLTSKASRDYAEIALESFFKNTVLSSNDEFILIDNDNENSYLIDNIKCNNTPKSFSQNCNDMIDLADGRNLFLLSNDVVFTPNWDQSLKQFTNLLVLPSCNQTHLYETKNLTLKSSMTLKDFDKKFFDLDKISQIHKRQNPPKLYERLLMGFYVFMLPYQVYKKIGYFDERFGIGGGEDVDYRIRAIQHDIPVKYSTQSYLLHFGGKTTWDGPEVPEEIQKRNQKYLEEFIFKWNIDLANLCLVGGYINPIDIIKKYNLEKFLENQDFSSIIKSILNISDRK